MGDPVTPRPVAAPPSTALVVAGSITAIVAMVVGYVNIGRSFGYDEAVTYAEFVNGGSPWRALTHQLVFNNHQLFSASQAVLWRIGFVGETSQRVPPVIYGAATAAVLTVWVGRRSDAVTGAIAGLLLVVNPVYVAEFRSLRGYSLATLAALVSVIATHRSWYDARLRWLVVAAVAMTTAVATHAYAVLPIALAAIWTLIVGHLRPAHLVSWAAAAAATLAIQFPLLDDARANSSSRGSRYLPEFPRRLAAAYLGERWAVIVILAALVGAGCWWAGRPTRRRTVAVVVSVAFVTTVVVALWQLVQPYDLYVRFFVSLTPYVAALAAFGAFAVPARTGLAAASIAIVLMIPNVVDVLRTEPPIRDAAAVAELARSQGLATCGAFTIPLSVYAPPVRSVDPTADGPAGFDDCEVFVAVIGIGPEGRQAAADRFERRTDLGGGVTLYSTSSFGDDAVALLGR